MRAALVCSRVNLRAEHPVCVRKKEGAPPTLAAALTERPKGWKQRWRMWGCSGTGKEWGWEVELAQFGVTNTAVTPEPELLTNNLVSHKCRAAAVSWCSYIPSQVCSKVRRRFLTPEHFNKAWSGSCCPDDTFCVFVFWARSEKYLPSKGGGWKKTVSVSRWEQAKIYLPLARPSCRKAFRLDLKLFWVKRKAAIDVKQNTWVKVIGMFLVKKNMMQKPT